MLSRKYWLSLLLGVFTAFILIMPQAGPAAAQTTSGVRAVQGLTVTGATGGTFTLTFNGCTTGPIAFNASAATVQAALNALPCMVMVGGVTVTETTSVTFYGFVITFNRPCPQPPMTGDSSRLGGGTARVTTATVTPGVCPSTPPGGGSGGGGCSGGPGTACIIGGSVGTYCGPGVPPAPDGQPCHSPQGTVYVYCNNVITYAPQCAPPDQGGGGGATVVCNGQIIQATQCPPGGNSGGSGPNVFLTCVPNPVQLGQAVDCLTNSSTSGSASIQSATINYGDGTSNPNALFPDRHIYAAPGSYTVTMQAADINGRTGQASTTVTVGSGQQPQNPAPAPQPVPQAPRSCSPPMTPSTPQLSATDAHTLSISWTTGSSNVSSFQLYIYDYATGNYLAGVPSLPASSTHYTQTGLIAGNTYAVKIRAINSCGYADGAWSGLATMPSAAAPPVGEVLGARTGPQPDFSGPMTDEPSAQLVAPKRCSVGSSTVFVNQDDGCPLDVDAYIPAGTRLPIILCPGGRQAVLTLGGRCDTTDGATAAEFIAELLDRAARGIDVAACLTGADGCAGLLKAIAQDFFVASLMNGGYTGLADASSRAFTATDAVFCLASVVSRPTSALRAVSQAKIIEKCASVSLSALQQLLSGPDSGESVPAF